MRKIFCFVRKSIDKRDLAPTGFIFKNWAPINRIALYNEAKLNDVKF